jgi:hypothetical protein
MSLLLLTELFLSKSSKNFHTLTKFELLNRLLISCRVVVITLKSVGRQQIFVLCLRKFEFRHQQMCCEHKLKLPFQIGSILDPVQSVFQIRTLLTLDFVEVSNRFIGINMYLLLSLLRK